MKAAEKVFLGFSVTLVLGCVGSILAVWLSGFGETILKPAVGLLSQGRRVAALSKKYPFKPPADGIIVEGRLDSFVGVSTRAKPSADALDAWLNGPGGEKGTAHVMHLPLLRGPGAPLATAFLKNLERGLETEKVSFDEFIWIRSRLILASVPCDAAGEGKLGAEVEALRKSAEDPHTPACQRARLLETIKSLDAVPVGSSLAARANRAIFERHEERLRACALGDRCVSLASEYATSSPGETRTIVMVRDSETPPSPPR